MSRLIALRRVAFRTGGITSACIGAYALSKPQASWRGPAARSMSLVESQGEPIISESRINAKTVQELSTGSVSGFAVGLVIALFSKTLAIIGGVTAILLHVAARQGINVPGMVGMEKVFKNVHVWEKIQERPWFMSSFALTFTLAAFAHL